MNRELLIYSIYTIYEANIFFVLVFFLTFRVTKLHQRWSQLRASFHTNLVQKLSGLRYPVQETTVTKQTRTVIEARQVDTNPYFRDLQEYTEWCQSKLKQLLAADYGSDLPSVRAELERHQQEHRVIDKFHSKVLHAERQQTNFSGDELHLYQQRLSQLQKLYAELLSTSTKRLSDLDALQNFLQAASDELQWLNDREQIEIGRDWAAKDLDLPGIHRYYEVIIVFESCFFFSNFIFTSSFSSTKQLFNL